MLFRDTSMNTQKQKEKDPFKTKGSSKGQTEEEKKLIRKKMVFRRKNT